MNRLAACLLVSYGLFVGSPASGQSGFSGDGGPANKSSLGPNGVAVDASGNLFIADTNNSRVRKVSADGIITTVAGNGNFELSGDGGPATAASLDGPVGVAVDGSGNLFIADSSNNRIRKVSANGVITTIAGNANLEFSGDGGPATAAQLNGPMGIAVDSSGNLYIADFFNSRIRKVAPNGIITTVAGGGAFGLSTGAFSGDGGSAKAAQLNGPNGVALDAAGNLFIADTNNRRIRKVSPSGIITTVAGNGEPDFSGDGGPALAASLDEPFGVAVDGSGNLYIADSSNNRIRKVSTNGIITTVAGSGAFGTFGSITGGYSGDGGPATAALLNGPTGIAVDAAGNLYIGDFFNSRVRKVSASGIITTVAGNGIYRQP